MEAGKHTAAKADWLIGPDLMGPGTNALALSGMFKEGLADQDDPNRVPIPSRNTSKTNTRGPRTPGAFTSTQGSPITRSFWSPDRLAGVRLAEGRAIRYRTLLALHQTSNFEDMVDMTTQSAVASYGSGSTEAKAVTKAWQTVGF